MGEVGRFPIFESITPNAVIASPLGRGNPHTLCHCEEGLEEN